MLKAFFSSLFAAYFVSFFALNAAAAQVEPTHEKIKLGGLLQFLYQSEDGSTPKDSFRIRRAEIKIDGEIGPKIDWLVRIDPAQVREDDVKTGAPPNVTSVGRKSPLQDFIITYKPGNQVLLELGQYKTPFGMEALESSSKLDFVERSMMSSDLKWSDSRDVGVTVKRKFNLGSVKIFPALGVFNGEGQNKYTDSNEAFDLAARVAAKPNDNIHFGVAHYNGKTGAAEAEKVHTGLEVKYLNDRCSLYGEYALGKSGGQNRSTYYLAGTCNLKKAFQAAVRFDFYDENTDNSGDSKTETTLGLNHFFEKGNAKVQLNYILRGEEGASKNNDALRLNFQVVY